MMLRPPFASDNQAQIYGLMMGGDAIAHESVSFGHDTFGRLAIANNPLWKDKVSYCLIFVEADATTVTKTRAIRWVQVKTASGSLTINETNVRAQGFPFGDGGVFEVKGLANMQNLRLIGIETGKTHTIRVCYFG